MTHCKANGGATGSLKVGFVLAANTVIHLPRAYNTVGRCGSDRSHYRFITIAYCIILYTLFFII